jgi:signal transduction histidine kinase
MRKILSLVVGLVGVLGMMAVAAAEGGHTPDQAKAFVEKAAHYFKSEGKDKALAVFSDPKGAFVDGDLYLVVMDAKDGQLTMLAHGVNKGLIGKPQIDIKDAEGRLFNQDTAAALAKGDDFWVSYSWPNPATKKIAKKRSYFMRVGDVIIGAGVYE